MEERAMSHEQARRILLVEDEPILAEITAFRLELLGFIVDRAKNANDVFAALDKYLPDAILIDMLLGGVSGFDVTEHLQNNERTSHIPVIALSSNADLENVERAFACGAKEYVVVPFDPSVLEQKLDKVLSAS
jgi:CheY-like chemotaxis protein